MTRSRPRAAFRRGATKGIGGRPNPWDSRCGQRDRCRRDRLRVSSAPGIVPQSVERPATPVQCGRPARGDAVQCGHRSGDGRVDFDVRARALIDLEPERLCAGLVIGRVASSVSPLLRRTSRRQRLARRYANDRAHLCEHRSSPARRGVINSTGAANILRSYFIHANHVRASLLATALMIAAAPVVFAQASYKKELPDALLKKAKVTKTSAAKPRWHVFPKARSRVSSSRKRVAN